MDIFRKGKDKREEYMKIGLLDVDRGKFPNLALMKISSYHKSIGDSVEFATMFENYDILYKSKVFTFSPDDEYYYRADKIIEGGTGYNISSKLPEEIDRIIPDYDLYNCDHAYGFLTRGCIRRCEWCLVPEKEGQLKAYMDIDEFIGNKKTAVLMDNNVLASEHGIKQIEKIIDKKIKIDFNQGLDARLIDNAMAKLLSKVKWLKPLRMACDSQSMKEPIKKATELLRKNNCTPKNYFIYTLIKDIAESLDRIMFLKDLNLDPYGQPYRDFKNNIEPTIDQKNLARWVNHKAIFKSVAWENYNT
jgi:hypothetical protein